MALVVDASVAVKWLVVEEDSDKARELVESGEELHAPRLLVSEVSNAVWRKARLGEVDPGRAHQLVGMVPAMPVRWYADEEICLSAIRLALALDRPVYDLMYLALAQRLDARVITADMRLVNALAQSGLDELVVPLSGRSRDG